jgi:cyclic beta-1,2-glucan synthetase
VRENGGQYTHAGVWALMAAARLARIGDAVAASPRKAMPATPEASPDTNTAYTYFTYLSPAHRAQNPVWGAAYGLEPYAVAGDVYSQPPQVGQGGWSWYTGAAGWLHRAAVESIFGLQLQADTLCLMPCLPSHWPRAELTLVRDGRRMRFILLRVRADADLQRERTALDAQLLQPGQPLAWSQLVADSCFVVPLLRSR